MRGFVQRAILDINFVIILFARPKNVRKEREIGVKNHGRGSSFFFFTICGEPLIYGESNQIMLLESILQNSTGYIQIPDLRPQLANYPTV